MEITLIRHAETVGNLAHLWQGQGDSELSRRGRRQARALGGRLPAEGGFDVVVGSDAGRAQATAALAGVTALPDPSWREIDIGAWEGLSRDEVFERFPEEIEALRSGEDVRLGGGETWREFASRVDSAFADLRSRLDDSGRALVVTHGGVIQSLVAGHLGIRDRPRPWPIDRIRNTALTVFRISDGEASLAHLNDARHAATGSHPDETGPVFALVRHGEAVANVEGRWQGLADDPLTDRGRAQARALAAYLDGSLAHVYSSASARALQTAAALVKQGSLPHTIREDLHEMAFGAWEDLTPEQIAERFPAEWRAIMVDGNDLPRGGTGETMAGAARRIGGALERIAADHPGGDVAVVSHGGAIRAYLCGFLGVPFSRRRRLGHPENTSVTRVRTGPVGPALVDYNLVPGN